MLLAAVLYRILTRFSTILSYRVYGLKIGHLSQICYKNIKKRLFIITTTNINLQKLF